MQFRGGKTPVLYLNSQPGETVKGRRRMIDRMEALITPVSGSLTAELTDVRSWVDAPLLLREPEPVRD